MNIFVCARREVEQYINKYHITHIISLLDPEECFPQTENNKHIPRLHIQCKDVVYSHVLWAPQKHQMQTIVDWVQNFVDANDNVLVHCQMGKCRSVAVGLALDVYFNQKPIDKAIAELKAYRPLMCPNPVVTMYMDEIMKLGGVLHDATEEIRQFRILQVNKNGKITRTRS